MARRSKKDNGGVIIIIILIIIIIAIGVFYSKSQRTTNNIVNTANTISNQTTKNTTSNNTSKNDTNTNTATNETNETAFNPVPGNNSDYSNVKETTESQEKQTGQSDKEKAINMVKEQYGDNSAEYVYDYYVNNQGKYIVSMSSKSNGTNYYFEVDFDKGTVEEY